MDPNFKILKEGNKTGEGFEIEVFGIKLVIDEGSSDGFFTIKKIAERNRISVLDIELCLRKYGVMTENSDISKKEYNITNCVEGSRNCGTHRTTFIFANVAHEIFSSPKGKDLETCSVKDLINLGIHVNEQFILELMKKP